MKIYNSQFAEEFYSVEEAVELVVNVGATKERFLIEAIEGPAGNFTTRVYVKRAFHLQPVGSTDPTEVLLWVEYDLPETRRDKPNDAIDQALSFLHERVRGTWTENEPSP